MRVIVEYIGSGVVKVVDTSVRMVVNPLPPRPKIDFYTNLQCAPNIGPEGEFRYGWGGDFRSWKVTSRHARKIWMRHPKRTENTVSARILNPLYSN